VITVAWSGKNFAPPTGIAVADTVSGTVSAARPVLQPAAAAAVATAAQPRSVRRGRVQDVGSGVVNGVLVR
jgi:hypothetical protein